MREALMRHATISSSDPNCHEERSACASRVTRHYRFGMAYDEGFGISHDLTRASLATARCDPQSQDEPIHPGNSGGPLINESGTVLGINTLVSESAQSVNFAVSMPQLRKELEKHIRGLQWD